MRVMLVGDVVGRPGRKALIQKIPEIVREKAIDFVIVNGENMAGGIGITEKVLDEVMGIGIDVFTSGNHIWDKKEIFNIIDYENCLLRPANYPPGTPGRGSGVYKAGKDEKIAVLNISGRVFMPALDCPFRVADEEVARLRDKSVVIIVDFHAEATSEKQAMAYFLDGKVSAVVGTHTHVQTADERILGKGTGFITDVGMTGPKNGILGIDREPVIYKFTTGLPAKFHVVKAREVVFNAVVMDIDSSNGNCINIERLSQELEI